MKNVRIVKLLSALIIISLLLPNHALIMAMQDSSDEPSAYTSMNNLVMNGDFEESVTTDDLSSWPNGMKPTYWSVKPWIDSRWGNPNFSLEQVSGSDNHYLKVDLKNDVSDKSRATMKSSKIEVESNTNYEFTIDLALESVSGNNFGFKVIEYDQDNKKIIENILITKQGTLGWSEFSGQISTKEQTKSVVIELWIGVTNALNNGGTIMIDNIRMSPLNNIPVSDIQIAEEIHGQVGTNHQLTAIITPSNSTNQNVTWTSENENVAVVGPDGLVELVGEGITKIIATAEDGGKTAICNVTSVSSSSSDPIVLNGDFEQSEATDDISTWPHAMKPTYWKVNPWLDPRWGNADFTLEQESGNQYVKVDLNSDVGGKVRTSMASSRFEVDPNAKYKFSIDYQLTSVWGNSFGVKVIEYDQNNNKIASTTLFTKQGNSEWSEFSTLIYTNEKTKFIVNEVWFGVNNALDNGGIIKFDNVRMIPQNAEVDEVELPDSATVYQGLTVKLDVVVKPENVANPNVRWTSSNPDIAAVDDQGVVTGVNIGTTVITATSESNPSAIATTMVTVKGFELEQMILPAEIMLEEYDTIKLVPKFIPPHTPNREVIWTSNNPEVASVDPNGLVTGFKAGEAIITATSINNREIKANTNIHVYKDDPATWDEFKKLQMKWKMVLLDGIPYTGNDTFIASLAEQKVKDINKEAQDLWDKLVTLSYRQYLWEDQQMVPGKNSDALVNSSKRLRTMALAFSMEGGELYHNTGLLVDIIESLDWIHENWYIISGDKYGNWWNWDIGAPLRFTDINILLADYLSLEQIKTYTNSIDYYEGDFTKISQTGANLSDVLSYELRLGIVEKNPERLASVRDQMSPLFEYVTTGDGFYLDGSFIQHGTIAYTGSYGEVTIQGTSNLLNMLNESRWEVTDPNVQNVYNWVFDAFAPVIYKGEMMDMVRGRAISRYNQSGHAAAAGVMSSIIRLAEAAPSEVSMEIKQMLKHWILSDQTCNVNQMFTSIQQLDTITSWLNDPSIEAIGDLPNHFELNAMNRSVHKRNDYAFGISKSSKRIWTYELTNGENRKGWYTGDGMTYLYNGDATQYSDDYWSTVDYNRLPGTTVVSRNRDSSQYQYGDGEGAPNNAWAGGTTLDKYGVSGMKLQQIGTQMSVNKSWFMFDNEIVALGSNLTSQDNMMVETTIEQRKINMEGSNVLTVDGEEQPTALGWTDSKSNVKWAHLAGSTPNSDIGYYFPGGQTVKMLRQQQTGTWFDVNKDEKGINGGPKDERVRNYLTMWYDHGTNPQAETYSYVLLPNKSAQEVEAYSLNPNIEILKNEADVQSVRNKKLGITGISFWGELPTKADFVTSNRQSSVMVRENQDHTLEIAVSDPTMENTGIIEIELDKSAASLIEADPQVHVAQLAPTIKLQINVNGSLGQSFYAKFDTDSNRKYAVIAKYGLGSGDYKAGDTVTITANEAPAGKEFDKWTTDNSSVRFANASNKVTTFVMPSEAVTVTATYKDKEATPSTPNPTPNPTPSPTPKPGDDNKPTKPIDPGKPIEQETPKVKLKDLDDHWAKDSIEKSVELGFVSGYEDGTFRPNAMVARGEFATMLAKALKLELDDEFRFADKDETPVWAKPHIQALAKAGFISGYGDGTFQANRAITRTELVVIMVRALGLEVKQNATPVFDDADQVPAWAKPYVATAAEAGLIKGNGKGKFNPNDSSTRAEAVTLILAMLNNRK